MNEQTPNPSAAISKTEKRVGKTLLTYALLAIVLGCIMAAILFQTWFLFFIGLVVLVPYVILLMAPVWAARTSRAAQGQGDNDEPRSTGPKP